MYICIVTKGNNMAKIATFTTTVTRRKCPNTSINRGWVDSQYDIQNSTRTTMQKTVSFGTRVYKEGNDWIVNAGYGYEYWKETRNEGAISARPYKNYDIIKQILPKEGDVIVHSGSNRVFTLGKEMNKNYIVYKFPMIENGKIVAYLVAEEYYKD